MNCTIRVAKTKALISFAVTAKLVCAFIFAYARCLFSHDVAANKMLKMCKEIATAIKVMAAAITANIPCLLHIHQSVSFRFLPAV